MCPAGSMRRPMTVESCVFEGMKKWGRGGGTCAAEEKLDHLRALLAKLIT